MARAASKDPLSKFHWSVSIDGFTKLGFASCDTPSYTISTQSYAEGGSHLHPRKIIDSIEYKPITLTRGVTYDRSFDVWARQVFKVLGINITSEDPVEYRKDITITHLDRAGRAVKTYKIYGAFPIEYKPASDFAADADDALSIETLVLAYESFEIETQGSENNPFSIKDITKRLIRRAF